MVVKGWWCSIKIHNAGGKTFRGSFNPSVLTEFAVNNDYLFSHESIMSRIKEINSSITEEGSRINLIYNVGLSNLKI